MIQGGEITEDSLIYPILYFMKVQDILNYAITSSYSGASSISMDTLMVYLNIEYHRLAQLIKNEVRNDFFYEKFTTDLVAGQNEYSFEEATTDKI